MHVCERHNVPEGTILTRPGVLNCGPLDCYTVIENIHCTTQFRFSRSKRRRIREKWAKRSSNFRPDRKAYVLHNQRVIVLHPALRVALERYVSLQRQNASVGINEP